MATISEIKTALLTISGRIHRGRHQVNKAVEGMQKVSDDLARLATDYPNIVADIQAAEAANPDNAALQVAGDEVGLLLAEYQVLKAEVDTKIAAIS